MADNWYASILPKVFTQVRYMLLKKYPSLNCTTKNENFSAEDGRPSKFPTLYMHELQPVEIGQDLTNESVNAIRCTIEIQVWTNSTEYECRNILNEAVKEMKRFRFNISALPIVETSDQINWGVIRATRNIGASDDIAQ